MYIPIIPQNLSLMTPAKFLFFLIAIFTITTAYSQKKTERYYDYKWRPCMIEDARFYSNVKNTDTGWYRTDVFINLKKIQMAGLYEDQENTISNGTFYWFYSIGIIKSVGRYVHNKKEGVWLNYFQDRSLKDSLNYKDGNLTGISLGWYSNGYPRDSLNVDAKGNGVFVSWFDNGNPSSAGKYIEFNKQQGTWQYFHKNGKLSSVEVFDHNILKDKHYFDENGSAITDTTSRDRDAYFAGGSKAWSKYMSKNLHFPSNYEIQNNHQIINVVTGTITDEGKVIDVEDNVPVSDVFDKLALDALKKSPNWIPAVSHNRKVYDTFSQSVNFSQSYD